MAMGRGTVFGVVLLIAAFPLLYWNEGRAIQSAAALGDEASSVHSVADSSRVDPANEGKLVHVTGRAATEEVLSDAEFGVSERAIRLERLAQIYQWEGATSDPAKVNRGLNSNCDGVPAFGPNRQFQINQLYSKGWSLKPRSSEHFTYPEGHQNPAVTPFWKPGRVWTAKEVRLGGYILPPELLSQIDAREPIAASPALLERVPGELRQHLTIRDGHFYLAHDLGQSTEQVGDVRFRFRVIRPLVVSILARQAGNSFAPFTTSNGTEVFRLAIGEQSASSMFDLQHAESTAHIWGVRFFGFLLMFFGVALSILAVEDWGLLPPAGTAFVATLCTIAAAWMSYRPLVAWALFCVAGVVGAAGLLRLVIGRRGE
jgi:Transmembrane protein 43